MAIESNPIALQASRKSTKAKSTTGKSTKGQAHDKQGERQETNMSLANTSRPSVKPTR